MAKSSVSSTEELFTAFRICIIRVNIQFAYSYVLKKFVFNDSFYEDI